MLRSILEHTYTLKCMNSVHPSAVSRESRWDAQEISLLPRSPASSWRIQPKEKQNSQFDQLQNKSREESRGWGGEGKKGFDDERFPLSEILALFRFRGGAPGLARWRKNDRQTALEVLATSRYNWTGRAEARNYKYGGAISIIYSTTGNHNYDGSPTETSRNMLSSPGIRDALIISRKAVFFYSTKKIHDTRARSTGACTIKA